MPRKPRPGTTPILAAGAAREGRSVSPEAIAEVDAAFDDGEADG
jgi:hypothetical protein